MSSINFKVLVENLLNESLGQQIMSKLTIPGGMTLEKAAIFASNLNKAGVSYLKIDTLINERPAWPIIDTFSYLLRTLANENLIASMDENSAKKIARYFSSYDTVEEVYNKLISDTNGKVQVNPEVLKSLQDRVIYLLNNFDNYRDFYSPKLKQINDKTQTLAAEPYLNLTPHNGIINLLKEYGGYDINLVENIIKYPGETRYTQKSNIEGPVLSSIVEISKLMLMFYREYIIEQTEADGRPVVLAVMGALGFDSNDINEFKRIVEESAGKLTPTGQAGKMIQQDYINFINGKSVLTIDPSVPAPINMPMNPPKPAIEKIADFRNITGVSQEVYQAFISLFNNIRKGTFPSKYKVLNQLAQAFGALSIGMGPVG
jgi:hypothetical protein